MPSVMSLHFSQHGSKVMSDATCRYERFCALQCLQKNEGDAEMKQRQTMRSLEMENARLRAR